MKNGRNKQSTTNRKAEKLRKLFINGRNERNIFNVTYGECNRGVPYQSNVSVLFRNDLGKLRYMKQNGGSHGVLSDSLNRLRADGT
jgi:hypothetical protein